MYDELCTYILVEGKVAAMAGVDVVIGVLSKDDWRCLVAGCSGITGRGGRVGGRRGDMLGIIEDGGVIYLCGGGEVIGGATGEGDVLG